MGRKRKRHSDAPSARALEKALMNLDRGRSDAESLRALGEAFLRHRLNRYWSLSRMARDIEKRLMDPVLLAQLEPKDLRILWQALSEREQQVFESLFPRRQEESPIQALIQALQINISSSPAPELGSPGKNALQALPPQSRDKVLRLLHGLVARKVGADGQA